MKFNLTQNPKMDVQQKREKMAHLCNEHVDASNGNHEVPRHFSEGRSLVEQVQNDCAPDIGSKPYKEINEGVQHPQNDVISRI